MAGGEGEERGRERETEGGRENREQEAESGREGARAGLRGERRGAEGSRPARHNEGAGLSICSLARVPDGALMESNRTGDN